METSTCTFILQLDSKFLDSLKKKNLTKKKDSAIIPKIIEEVYI